MTNYNVTSGQHLSGITLNSGDFAYVSSGGTASGLVVEDGAALTVFSGGTASATVISGGFEYVSSGGTATGAVVSGGTEAVDGGGTASFAVVSANGTQAVYSGGNALGTDLSGLEEIYSGGSVNGLVVMSGGDAFVYSGGTATGTVILTGGGETLYGVASGAVVSSGGTLTVNSGGMASFTVVSRGGAIDLPGLIYSSGGSAIVDGSDVLTVTEGGGHTTFQLAGSYGGEHFQTSQDSIIGTLITLVEPPRTMVWTGAPSASFAAAADWDDVTNALDPAVSPPNPTDTAEFLTGGGTITGTGTAAALAFGGPVSWDVASGASLSATTEVIVGQGGGGTLLVNGGAGIDGLGASDQISGTSGQAASVLVDGTGSKWKSSGELIVGALGSGALTVSNAASVSAAAAGSLPAMVLGASAGGSGALTVTGASSDATLLGQLNVGQAGAGALTVANQATVITGGSTLFPSQGVDVAQAAGGAGSIEVSGTRSLLSNTGEFIVGDAGLGGLTIGAGGSVVTTPGTVAGLAGLVIANTASASGSSVNVSGTGSNLGVTGLLDVGLAGSGGLQLSGGGTVSAGSLDAGVSSSAVGQIGLSGTGTSLNITGNATIADSGTGVLSILAGATVNAASLSVGAQSGSSGALVISGNGSDLNLTGALNIGSALGIGDLTLGPGAAVHASVINQQGQEVLEGGLLDPSVNLIRQGSTTGGSGTIAANDVVDEGVIQAGGSTPSQLLLLVQGTVFGGGTLTVNGVVQKSEKAAPLQINDGGTLELQGAVLNAASVTVMDDLTPTGTYTVTHSVVDVSFSDATGVLLLDDIAGFAGTIAVSEPGDQIVITGGTLSGLAVSNSKTLTVQDSGAGAQPGGIDRIIFSTGLDLGGFSIVNGNTIVACFVAGTRIGTEDGSVAVEALVVGDRVSLAAGGSDAVVWVGHRRVDCARHPKPETVWPVCVSAGAFGGGVPVRDLWLSPDHAVFVDGVLVPVKLLVNGGTIRQVVVAEVTYYHVELPEHAVILAEGLTVESYLDAGDRGDFADQDVVRLFPDFGARLALDAATMWETRGAAPLVMAGERLEAVRRGVVETAPLSPVRPEPAVAVMGSRFV